MHYVSKHSDQNFIFFVFLYFAMLCAMFQNIAVKCHFLCISLFCYAMCYVLCFQTQRSKFHFLCISLFCYAMRYVSKHSGQNFIFFVFLYFAMLCVMFENIALQNFSFFVFIYFAMLCAMVQNIVVIISFSLYLFILLWYALCFKL